jgi:flagellar hook-associated protein 1 FlgK
MASSIFGIATSGLNAAQAGLLTTSHNIANVNTAGFSRQQIVQTTPVPQYTGAGFAGAGVAVVTIRRSYSEFLELQVRDTGSQAAAADTLLAQLRSLDDLLGDPAGGLAPVLQGFFDGVNQVASYPADAAARQALVSGAEALAARFVDLDARFAALRDSANGQIESTVSTLNAYASRLADLNRQIMGTSGQGAQAQSPNDLLDQRDALLRDLGGQIGISTVLQSDGSLNVFLSSGQALVVGGNAYALSTTPDPESPQDMAVGIGSGSGVVLMRASDLRDGQLGGLLEFRDRDLADARNALGRIAMALAAQFNAQHQLGQDLSGAPGGQFFAAGTPAVAPRSSNAGSAQLSASVADFGALGASGYRVSWDGLNWQVARLADGATQSFATLPQVVDGVAIALASGTPAAGDSFRIEPSAAGAANFAVLVHDVKRIAAAAPIRSASGAANTGSGTVSAGSVNAPPPPDANLRQTVTITFTGAGSFDVAGTGTGNPGGLAYTPGATLSFNGWSIALSGAPAAGDTFTVSANAGGVADNRNMLRLTALQTERSLEGGAASYTDAYGLLTSEIGNRTRGAQVSAEGLQRLADQASAAQQSVSGVNLDEEAANLLRYQQAYQASGKALAIASQLFDTLLQIGGR